MHVYIKMSKKTILQPTTDTVTNVTYGGPIIST